MTGSMTGEARAAVRIAVLQMTTGIDPAVNAHSIADAAAQAAGEGACLPAQPPRRLTAENIGTARSANQQRHIGTGQATQAGCPELRCRGQPLPGRQMHRKFVMQHVWMCRQPELMRRDVEIQFGRWGPVATDHDHTGFPAGLPADPFRRRFVAAPGHDDEIRPGRRQRAGFAAVEAKQGDVSGQSKKDLVPVKFHLFDDKGPSQSLGQAQALGVIAKTMTLENPDGRNMVRLRRRNSRACRR